MELESKISTLEPAEVRWLDYHYQEKQKFLNEASKVINKIPKA